MKKILFILLFANSILYSQIINQIGIEKPQIVNNDEHSLITENQKNALKRGSGFYYKVDVQYVRPFLVNLETDEYYFYKDKNETNRMSLTKLCSQNYLSKNQSPLMITLARDSNHKIEENIFTFFPYEKGEKSCLFTSEAFSLPLRKYQESIVDFKIDLHMITDKNVNFQMLNRSSLQMDTQKAAGYNIQLDMAKDQLKSVYIPLSYNDANKSTNAGLISLTILPVASKIADVNFTTLGYPDFSNTTLENLKHIENYNNKKRTLKNDILNFKTLVQNVDNLETFHNNYDFIETMLDEYYLSLYDKALVSWLIFNGNTQFPNSAYYKDLKSYFINSSILKEEVAQEEIVKEEVGLPEQEKVSQKEVVQEKITQVDSEDAGTMIVEQVEKKISHTTPKVLDYNKLPISAISMQEVGNIMKSFGIAMTYNNRKTVFTRLFPKNEIIYYDINGFRNYFKDSKGTILQEPVVVDREELINILAPLKKEKLGCWTKLATTRYIPEDKKTVTLAEELKQNEYEIVSFYKDRNSSIGNNGYLILYTNYSKRKINSIAFEQPTIEFYEIMKDRFSKSTGCYKLLRKFKRDVGD